MTKGEQCMSVRDVGLRNGRSRRNVGHEFKQQSERGSRNCCALTALFFPVS